MHVAYEKEKNNSFCYYRESIIFFRNLWYLLHMLILLQKLCVALKLSYYTSCYNVHNFHFSEELLLQEDGSDVSSLANEFSKSMHLGQALVPTDPLIGVRRFSRTSNASSNIPMQR